MRSRPSARRSTGASVAQATGRAISLSCDSVASASAGSTCWPSSASSCPAFIALPFRRPSSPASVSAWAR
jgi:hypothetical protein